MKKFLFFLAMIITINVSAQSTTWFGKPLELDNVPASNSKSDSILVRGVDKIIKWIPRSSFSSVPNLQSVLDVSKTATITNPDGRVGTINFFEDNFELTASAPLSYKNKFTFDNYEASFICTYEDSNQIAKGEVNIGRGYVNTYSEGSNFGSAYGPSYGQYRSDGVFINSDNFSPNVVLINNTTDVRTSLNPNFLSFKKGNLSQDPAFVFKFSPSPNSSGKVEVTLPSMESQANVFLPLSVNGNIADSTGNITITIPVKEDIIKTVENGTTTALTSSDLNTYYPTVTIGFRVIAASLSSGGLIYEKTLKGWISTEILSVP